MAVHPEVFAVVLRRNQLERSSAITSKPCIVVAAEGSCWEACPWGIQVALLGLVERVSVVQACWAFASYWAAWYYCPEAVGSASCCPCFK